MISWHEISNNVVCAISKGSNQPAHTRSLIRAFASHLNILWILIRVQLYIGKPWFTLNKYRISIHFWLYRYKSLPYVSSSQFSSKIARKYPLLALKLPKNRVVFKTRSFKKKGKKRRCGIIPDMNYTNLDCVQQNIVDFQALEDVYSVRQTSIPAITYCLRIVYTFSIHPFKLFPHFKYWRFIVKTCTYLFVLQIRPTGNSYFRFQKRWQTDTNYYSEISKTEGTNLIISP